MGKLMVVLMMSLVVLMVEGKHLHPRSILRTEELVEVAPKNDEVSIDIIRNLKPSRFVPFNSVLFYKPCEEGFERDLLGACREVWD